MHEHPGSRRVRTAHDPDLIVGVQITTRLDGLITGVYRVPTDIGLSNGVDQNVGWLARPIERLSDQYVVVELKCDIRSGDHMSHDLEAGQGLNFNVAPTGAVRSQTSRVQATGRINHHTETAIVVTGCAAVDLDRLGGQQTGV